MANEPQTYAHFLQIDATIIEFQFNLRIQYPKPDQIGNEMQAIDVLTTDISYFDKQFQAQTFHLDIYLIKMPAFCPSAEFLILHI